MMSMCNKNMLAGPYYTVYLYGFWVLAYKSLSERCTYYYVSICRCGAKPLSPVVCAMNACCVCVLVRVRCVYVCMIRLYIYLYMVYGAATSCGVGQQ